MFNSLLLQGLYQKFPLFTKYIFLHPDGYEGKLFNFSSDLEKIGIEWDVSIRNGTYIDVISEPIEITRPQYGAISVVKIKADVATDYHTIIKEFWVPITCVVKVENNAIESSELSD
jgi:hypothetical protein